MTDCLIYCLRDNDSQNYKGSQTALKFHPLIRPVFQGKQWGEKRKYSASLSPPPRTSRSAVLAAASMFFFLSLLPFCSGRHSRLAGTDCCLAVSMATTEINHAINAANRTEEGEEGKARHLGCHSAAVRLEPLHHGPVRATLHVACSRLSVRKEKPPRHEPPLAQFSSLSGK